MTKINDILNFFETFAPVGSAMDFDNVGLLAGSENATVTKVLVSLDITENVVHEAEEMGCELIISHHPVIFNPLKRLADTNPVYLLAKYGIAAVCMHTNLDLSTDCGVNVCLADAIGVKNVKLCDCGECLFCGTLEKETDILSFAQNVKSALNCKGLRFTDSHQKVKTVAVSSGAGGSNAAYAAKIGADVLVTGEIKHHEINESNSLGLSVVEAGHFKSENIVILPLKNKLAKQFPDVKFTKSRTYDDFIKFI